MSDYTPTTEEIKSGWVSNCWEFTYAETVDRDYEDQFDRWLKMYTDAVRMECIANLDKWIGVSIDSRKKFMEDDEEL